MRVIHYNLLSVSIVFFLLTLCVVAQENQSSESNETIIFEFNDTFNGTNTTTMTTEFNETVNETINTTINNIIEEESNQTANVTSETPEIICSSEQCDVACAICRDNSCYAPEIGCQEKITIEKITPTTINKGEQQLNILMNNTGNVAMPFVAAEVVGFGIATVEEIPIEVLAVGDKDYTFTKVSVTEAGTVDIIVKISVNGTIISQQIFQITVISEDIQLEQETELFNLTQGNEIIAQLKEQYDVLETQYYEKEKKDYILYGIKEDLDDIKEALRLAQVAIIEENQKDFDKNSIYAATSLATVQQQVESAEKEKKTMWEVLYENLAVIGSVLGVLISVVTVWSMTKVHLKKARVINVIKGKQILNIGKKEDVQNIVENNDKEDTDSETKDL